MRYFALIVLSIFVCSQGYAMKLSNYEFENVGIINKEIKKKYPQFQGFNGSADDMKVIGLDEELVRKEINKLDIPSLIADLTKDERLRRKNLIQKLKAQGFTKDDLKSLFEKSTYVEEEGGA